MLQLWDFQCTLLLLNNIAFTPEALLDNQFQQESTLHFTALPICMFHNIKPAHILENLDEEGNCIAGCNDHLKKHGFQRPQK